ncbi:MAG: hypothetical protein RLN76_05130 [Phycisphaeraceae bacterium]
MPEMTMVVLLAWRPFLDPLPIEDVWLWFLIPLSLAVALVYKAIKLPTLERLWIESVLLGFQILAFMALAAVGLWILTEMV